MPIVYGCIFSIVCLLLIQLLYLFLAVGYNELARSYGWSMEFGSYLAYATGIPLYLLSLLGGGYIAAEFSEQKPVIHGMLSGAVVSLLLLVMALQNAQLTVTGILLMVCAVIAAYSGGRIWLKQHPDSDA